MNVATRPADPGLRRRVEVAALVALIDHTLTAGREFLPFGAAGRLLVDLDEAGIARVEMGPSRSTVSIHGIAVTGDATAAGMLRNWQGRAKDWLAKERRR